MEIRKIKLWAGIILIAFAISGCRATKKKCDCPGFGKAPVSMEKKKIIS